MQLSWQIVVIGLSFTVLWDETILPTGIFKTETQNPDFLISIDARLFLKHIFLNSTSLSCAAKDIYDMVHPYAYHIGHVDCFLSQNHNL